MIRGGAETQLRSAGVGRAEPCRSRSPELSATGGPHGRAAELLRGIEALGGGAARLVGGSSQLGSVGGQEAALGGGLLLLLRMREGGIHRLVERVEVRGQRRLRRREPVVTLLNGGLRAQRAVQLRRRQHSTGTLEECEKSQEGRWKRLFLLV